MTDRQLQDHVLRALDWDPSVETADIGVTVDNGVVTLRGDVDAYAERHAAEDAASRVPDVKAIVNHLDVRSVGEHPCQDRELTRAAVRVLRLSTAVPYDRVTVSVSDGWVTLTGAVGWQFQKEAAARVVRDLAGVRGVTDHVVVWPQVIADDIQAQIEAALEHTAALEARRINVSVQNGTIMLTGNVHSRIEREAAERAAWLAPGVTHVDDQIAVVP